MKIRLLIAAVSLYLVASCTCDAEYVVDGPYVGRIHPFRKPEREVAVAVEHSNLIFVGVTERLDVSEYNGNNGCGFYKGNITPVQVLKGMLPQPSIVLTWEPSATGIHAGSKHIFF